MKSQVAQILNVEESQILEIHAWAFVYWVKIAGRRPTLVSIKKVEDMLSSEEEFSEKVALEKAQKIAEIINSRKSWYLAKVWQNYGKTRVYVSKEGFVEVLETELRVCMKTKSMNSHISEVISEVLQNA
jgi:hypothetical protein